MRPTEVVEQEKTEIRTELDELMRLPGYFVIAGQVVDNRDRIAALRARLAELDAELRGVSGLQGPDLIV